MQKICFILGLLALSSCGSETARAYEDDRHGDHHDHRHHDDDHDHRDNNKPWWQ